MMTWIEHVQAAAPTGKALLWVGGSVVTSFLAGIGWMSRASEFSDTIDQVPIIQNSVDNYGVRLNAVEYRLDHADQDRERILCLVTLTATGEQVTPLQVAERCP